MPLPPSKAVSSFLAPPGWLPESVGPIDRPLKNTHWFLYGASGASESESWNADSLPVGVHRLGSPACDCPTIPSGK